MTIWDEWVQVVVGAISLELPAAVIKTGDTAIDSIAGVFQGGGLTVSVDQGGFASRPGADVGRADYREDVMDVCGTKARTIFFRNPEVRVSTSALYLPPPTRGNVVVQADASVPQEIPRKILESVRLLD